MTDGAGRSVVADGFDVVGLLSEVGRTAPAVTAGEPTGAYLAALSERVTGVVDELVSVLRSEDEAGRAEGRVAASTKRALSGLDEVWEELRRTRRFVEEDDRVRVAVAHRLTRLGERVRAGDGTGPVG